MFGQTEIEITRDDFESWLIEMDCALDRFYSSVPSALRSKLDLSKGSLDDLEDWLLKRYSSHEELLKPSELASLDGVSRYIGETFRRSLGGRWNIRLDDPKYAFYRIPELSDFGPTSTPVCPSSLATTTLSRRKGTFLSGILANLEKRYANSIQQRRSHLTLNN
jgi:hypothetical protein